MSKIPKTIFLICLALFLCPAVAGAQEDLVWPVKMDLVAKDWTQTDAQPWVKVGEVQFWNTRENMTIEILPGIDPYTRRPFRIKVASIVTTNTPDFSLYLDKLGKPNPAVFPLKTDYLMDFGIPTDHHTETIPLDRFALCWGTIEQCPNDRYAIIHADLMREEEDGSYTILPEPAFGGVATDLTVSTASVTYVEPFLDRKDIPLGWYVIYPFAKVQTGHFVDAKVKGLTFRTPTQSGTSSDSGNFFYIPPEAVDFWVGPLHLGSAEGDHTLSPIDLFPGSDLDDNRVLNVARLLQSLDSHDQSTVVDVTANIPCLEKALSLLGTTSVDFGVDSEVETLLGEIHAACPTTVTLVTQQEARANLDIGQQGANILKTNVSKNGAMPSDKAKIEIMPFYVPALKADGTATTISYHDDEGNVIETRTEAKPLIVVYEEEVEGTGSRDIFAAISRDDGSTWKRTNISKTAGRSSLDTNAGPAAPGPGEANKPMLSVKDNMMLLAWTGKYCHGGRPGYAITRVEDRDCDLDGDGTLDGVLQVTHEGETCMPDYPGDDAYWQDDKYGVGGPQRSVLYEDEWALEMGEVPYSCIWTARGKIESDGSIVWYKPEKITSGRRDANQLVSAAADDAGVAIAWQEDPKGLQPPSDYGPGDGWSGANVTNKTDIWYSFLKWADFDLVDAAYPNLRPDNDDIVDTDPELAGRIKALVPFSLPAKITDNDMCSYENILAEGGDGGDGDHVETTDADPVVIPGDGTHRYCGTLEGIGTAATLGSNPLCAYTIPITNHNGELHNVCVTADADFAKRRVLDGNTGASRPNLFLQPYTKADGTKSAWAMLAYEESKGLGTPPEVEGEDDEDRYKPDLGKNVIYHSFEYTLPETVSGGGILNQPETDAEGNAVYVVAPDELGNMVPVLDALARPVLAYENARRVRLLHQPKSKVGTSKTVLVALWREGAEGHGKAADIFMRRMTVGTDKNPYSFNHFAPTVQNVSSVQPGEIRSYVVEDPGTGAQTTIDKMVNWSWGAGNLSDKSGTEPYSDAKAHRGALNGDELILGYTWTPNWGRLANDKYDLYIRRSWDGGQTWKTDPKGAGPIEHTIVFVDPETKEETVTITSYGPGELEPPRNVSNIRNNRISVLEPRIVKTPGTIKRPDGSITGYPEDIQDLATYQVAWGLEVNIPGSLLDDGEVVPFRTPLDIYYGRTTDKGQNFENVFVTRADGSGSTEQGWNLLAKDKPEQAGAQLKQTPDGSRMYAVWVEKGEAGSDIMFRRVDYRPPAVK